MLITEKRPKGMSSGNKVSWILIVYIKDEGKCILAKYNGINFYIIHIFYDRQIDEMIICNKIYLYTYISYTNV